MQEEKLIKRNMIKNIIINFIIFLTIFFVFDLIIYNQVSISSYKTIDEELTNAKGKYVQREIENTSIRLPKNNIDNNKQISPRIITIIRNESGEVINNDAIGRIYEDFGNEIPFNSSNLDSIYEIQLSGNYKYRAINCKRINMDGQKEYIQFLINIDGEKQALNSILNVLIFGTIIIMAIALLASYILAERVMKPIMHNYKKQAEFVQNASHELRTPLTIIQAQQELLLKEPNSKIIDKSESINQTLKETKRMTKLIKELMNLARADSNNTNLNKMEIDINKLIQEIVKPYKDYASLQKKTINLNLEYAKTIKVDQNKINELIIILLDNAIKYTNENDTITIKTYDKDGKLNIEIADTGIGISEESMPHVFERFYRGDKSHSKEIEGTGLGLSIAKTIVEMHNGTIKLKNNNPKGTVVLIRMANAVK